MLFNHPKLLQMDLLNQNQIDRIHDILVANGASTPMLLESLIDHICCMVEGKMQNENCSFEEALYQACKQFDLNQVTQIEQSTNYLLNENLNIMKNIAGISGVLGAVLTIVGTILKLTHSPGAGISLVLGLITICCLTLPLMATITFKSMGSNYQKLTSLLGYGAAFIGALGALFKIMHWPGANLFLGIGFGILLLAFLPLYTIKTYRLNENKWYGLASSLLIIAGVFVFLLSSKMVLNSSETIQDGKSYSYVNLKTH